MKTRNIFRALFVAAALAAVATIAAACAGDDDDSPAATVANTAATATAAHQGMVSALESSCPTVTPAPQLEILDVRARATTNDVTGVFFTVRNGGAADRLVGASVASTLATEAQVHETVTEGASSRMQQVAGIDVPAAGELVLKPGGYHVMLLGVKRPLAEGETIEVTLKFQHAGEKTVQAKVMQIGSSMSGGSMSGGMGGSSMATPTSGMGGGAMATPTSSMGSR